MTVTVDFQVATEAQGLPQQAEVELWATTALSFIEDDCELSIRLVDEAESAELNGQYRGKDYPTNVLSFPFDAPVALSPRLLGDLVICVQVVEREAEEQNKPLAHHWAHMVVHGCLHLLGYDHIEDEEAQEMEALEVELLASLNIANPYDMVGSA